LEGAVMEGRQMKAGVEGMKWMEGSKGGGGCTEPICRGRGD
jgi:hypothetical protein